MHDNYSAWPHSSAEAQRGWGKRKPDELDIVVARAVLDGEDPAVAMGRHLEQKLQQNRESQLLSAALDGERSLARTRQTKAARLIREAMDILGVDLNDLEDVSLEDVSLDDLSLDDGDSSGVASGASVM